MAATLGFAPTPDGARGVWKGVAVVVGASESPPLMRARVDLLTKLDLDLEVRSLRALPRTIDGSPARTHGSFKSRALGKRLWVSVAEPARAEVLFDKDLAWALADASSWGILLNDFCASIELSRPTPEAVPLAIRCLSRIARRVERARRHVPPPAWGLQIHAAMSHVASRLGLEVRGCPMAVLGHVGEITIVGGPGGEVGSIRVSARSRDGALAETGRAPSPAMLPLVKDLQQRGTLGFDADEVVWISGPMVGGADLEIAVEVLVSLARKWFGHEDGGPYR